MRCGEGKYWRSAEGDNDIAQPESSTRQEHLKQCTGCRAHEHRQQRLDTLLRTPTTHMHPSVSTQRIMQEVEQQIRITRQLEDLRARQQSRVARLRIFTPKFAAFAYLTIGLISLSLLALFIFHTDLVIKALALVNNGIDALMVLARYIQKG